MSPTFKANLGIVQRNSKKLNIYSKYQQNQISIEEDYHEEEDKKEDSSVDGAE